MGSLFSCPGTGQNQTKDRVGERIGKNCYDFSEEGKRMARQKMKEWTENDQNLSVVRAWARAGKTDMEIAALIGVSRSTLSAWKKKCPRFLEALAVGKEMADRLVEDSLFLMTQGRVVTIKKTFKLRERGKDERGNPYEREYLEQGEDEEYVPPEIKAIIFWLKNRRPEDWKEKLEQVRDSQEDGGGLIVLTPKVIRELGDMANGEVEGEDGGDGGAKKGRAGGKKKNAGRKGAGQEDSGKEDAGQEDEPGDPDPEEKDHLEAAAQAGGDVIKA